MALEFWATVGAAALGGIGSGLLLQWNLARLSASRQKIAYESLRLKLTADVHHGLLTLDKIWMQSQRPERTVALPNVTWELLLKGATIRLSGVHPHPLRFEMWNLARSHLLPMASNVEDGPRFAQAFQTLEECLSEGPTMPMAVQNFRDFLELGMHQIYQATGVTNQGHQISSVPWGVFRATGDSTAKQHLVDLVLDFGTDAQADEAAAIAEHDWMGGAWKPVDGAWVYSELYPNESRVD